MSSLHEAYYIPPPHTSESTTEESFHSTNVQENIPNEQVQNNADFSVHSPMPSDSETYLSPSLCRDVNISSNSVPELLDKIDGDKKNAEKIIRMFMFFFL